MGVVATMTLSGATIFTLLLYLVVVILTIIAWIQILRKAGYSSWWILIAFVPLVNFLMFFVFAFSRWPVLGEPKANK